MRILIPVSTFERAGGFRVLSELASHWVDSGAQVDFLVDHRSDDPHFPTRARVLRFDLQGVQDTPTPRGRFTAGGNALSIYGGMWRAVQQVGAGYDIVLANHSLTSFPIWLARTGAAAKVYYIQAYEPEFYEHPRHWRNAVLRAVTRLSYALPLQRVVNAPLYLKYREIRATRWIPPGLDTRVFARRHQAPSFVAGQPYWLGTIGRTEPIKGTADVLMAFEQLAARDPRAHLRVAFGNLPPGWSHPRCEVVRPQGDAGLADFYRGVDLLLAPGTAQLGACHYPVMEAMACGTPVITTGYMPADTSNAWIVPVHAPAQIAQAVLDLTTTPAEALLAKLDLAFGAIQPFAWPHVATEFLELFAASRRP
jgi:glycosyltransferase involved in cell wall biosynthesis